MTEKTPCMAPLIAEHEVDYGPLAALAGTWYGESGTDVAPEPDGKEINPFHETIVFTPAGDTTNAEEQTLVAMHYHQVVRRKSDHKVFHNETGFWPWEPATGRVRRVSAPLRVLGRPSTPWARSPMTPVWRSPSATT